MATRTTAKPAAAPADSPVRERVTLTASLVDLARQKRNQTHEFELTATSEAVGQTIIAEVRRVDLNSVDAILALPDRLQRQIFEMQMQVDKMQQKGVTNEDGTVNEDVGLKALQMMQEARELYAVAGFVNPSLIQHESHRTRDDQIVAGLIDSQDLNRFYEWCTGQSLEASATAARFPDRPGEDVATGGPGGVDRDTTEPSASAA
jgi:hypothetical protein